MCLLHLDILVDRLKREFKVEANIGKPQVAYREALKKKTDIEAKYIRFKYTATGVTTGSTVTFDFNRLIL